METIVQQLTMVETGATTSKTSHPFVVAFGSRDNISQTFLTVEDHTVPISRGGLTSAVDRMCRTGLKQSLSFTV
jgi:hypothetical protein